MINKIKELFGKLTHDMSKTTKVMYMNSFGFSKWEDIVNASDEDKISLLEKLQTKGILIKEDDDYIIKRPTNPKSVKDIIFMVKG